MKDSIKIVLKGYGERIQLDKLVINNWYRTGE